MIAVFQIDTAAMDKAVLFEHPSHHGVPKMGVDTKGSALHRSRDFGGIIDDRR